MDEITTIAVKKSTLHRLKELQEYARESYDETINKLVSLTTLAKKDEDGELNSGTIKEIELARKEIRQGKGMSTKELMKKLGIE